MDWERDGRDWPLREASRFVEAGGVRWHLQRMGQGPAMLLLHGTGASAHSWRDLLPALAAAGLDVLAVDLPGHGFSSRPPGAGLSLPGMAAALADLLGRLGVAPAWIVGHSAGAAIAARLCLDGRVAPRGLVGLNAAMLPLGGLAGRVFSPAAKLLALNPLVPRVFAWRAGDAAAVRRLVDSTGSRLNGPGQALYGRLVRDPGHVAAALGMMAQWDLQPLQRELPRLATPLVLVVGERDRTLPPSHADAIAARVAGSRVWRLPGLGHLAHEEDPSRLLALLTGVVRGDGTAIGSAPAMSG